MKLNTTPRVIAAIIVVAFIVIIATALGAAAQGTGGGQSSNIVLWLAGALAAGVVGGSFARLSATSERYAAPARAKSPEDRTLTDKLIIEADARIDAFDVQRIEGFATDFIAAHLDDVLRQVPVLGPLATAAGMVDTALDAYRRRNPTVAARQAPSVATMTEKLAGAIGKKDVLADALREAVKASTGPRA